MYNVKTVLSIIPLLLFSVFLLSCGVEGQFGSISPDSARPGEQNVIVEIVGNNTHFVPGLTFIFFDPMEGITVSNIDVENETTVTFEMDVDSDVETGYRTAVVVYPVGYIVLEEALEILRDPTITLGDCSSPPDSFSCCVAVILENEIPISAVQFAVIDESGYLTLAEVRTTSRTEGFMASLDKKSGTVVLISLSGKTIAPGNGPILKLHFEVSVDAPEGECIDLNLENVVMADEYGRKVGVELLPGQFCFTESMPTTTTTTASSCPSELIYGEHSEQTELLRYFRDNILSTSPAGQEIIKLYYEWSPAIVQAMENDEEFKEEVKGMIDGVLELIE